MPLFSHEAAERSPAWPGASSSVNAEPRVAVPTRHVFLSRRLRTHEEAADRPENESSDEAQLGQHDAATSTQLSQSRSLQLIEDRLLNTRTKAHEHRRQPAFVESQDALRLPYSCRHSPIALWLERGLHVPQDDLKR
eukprot:SAG31_NODE_3810_length_3862_cov_2.467712_6_plen_137_part_00